MAADEDFDVASLARYLHLTPPQVDKLVNREQIPFRRVGGEIRFSPAEVHHWMEERMGVLDDAELAKVEEQLVAQHTEAPWNLTDALTVDTIAVPLRARTRNSVIVEMAQLAATTGMLWDPDKMADAVRAREDLQSTAMDNGVALLHPRRPLPNILGDTVVALGVSGQGIPFGGSRVLTDVFWLIGSLDDRTHLRNLARISRVVGTEGFLDRARDAATAGELRHVVQEVEQILDVDA